VLHSCLKQLKHCRLHHVSYDHCLDCTLSTLTGPAAQDLAIPLALEGRGVHLVLALGLPEGPPLSGAAQPLHTLSCKKVRLVGLRQGGCWWAVNSLEVDGES
jgi:hypothetical protein